MPAIGITGGISTGKSTFCDCLREIIPAAKFFDADRAAREANLTRSGMACAPDCFLPIWQSASAESFAPYRVAGTMREFMDHIASHGRRIHGVA